MSGLSRRVGGRTRGILETPDLTCSFYGGLERSGGEERLTFTPDLLCISGNLYQELQESRYLNENFLLGLSC